MYSIIDLAVCVGYFLVVVAVGFISSRRQHTSVQGYFRADNRLPWYVIGFSIVAAGISSEQFVGEVGYAYKLGLPVVNWEWLVLPGLSLCCGSLCRCMSGTTLRRCRNISSDGSATARGGSTRV